MHRFGTTHVGCGEPDGNYFTGIGLISGGGAGVVQQAIILVPRLDNFYRVIKANYSYIRCGIHTTNPYLNNVGPLKDHMLKVTSLLDLQQLSSRERGEISNHFD